jgi:hypothetical protein
METEAQLNHWKDHFQELINWLVPADPHDISTAETLLDVIFAPSSLRKRSRRKLKI